MRRRHCLKLVGALTLATPFIVTAQTPGIPRVGVLVPSNPDFYRAHFRDALRGVGYIEGSSISLEFRSADGRPDRLASLAAELVQLKVDVIVAFQTPAAEAAKRATPSIPIVVAAGDPVATGLVTSLARPGGNVTGWTGVGAEISGKLLEMTRELVPSARKMAVLVNAPDPFAKPFLEHLQLGARSLGLAIEPIMIGAPADIETAFRAFDGNRPDAVVVQPSLPAAQPILLALQHRLPAISSYRAFVIAGGLVGYSAAEAERFQQVANYVDRILKGAKPADLPVVQAVKFELTINLRTARAIGIEIPHSLLARADEVIE